ncbi:MAG: indolepyruvate ferredoxin oxidoreductase subunit alpha [Bacillota bacterium]|jgi:indolepyruvate ferredoxin oxidoreductase alpha subunit
MTGNQAVARGFWEAGGRVVASYPGTPSTEITENAAKYEEIHAEWSPNEKVAVEVANGAAIGGARAMSCMKHVGVNVAADPLFTASYIGINSGLVIVSADDPGMHSSQNEQDNRNYARASKIPALEPADSVECKEYVKAALEISEEFDTPVMLRLTTRIAHSQSLVELSDREEIPVKPYEKNIAKNVMVPANAIRKHPKVEARTLALAERRVNEKFNVIEWGNDKKMGIVASGAVYQYVKEVLPEVSVLKIGMPFPLCEDIVRELAAGVERLIVIEELDPFLEEIIRGMGIEVEGKNLFPKCGEIFAEDIAVVLGDAAGKIDGQNRDVPVRPPVLCPGCPHRGVFYVLKQLGLVVSGDIGCYTLGAAAPLASIDTTVCMGASVSGAHGLEMAQGKEFAKKTVAVIGDSTFIHSGITGLINTVYNGGTTTTMILDNSITAMTGHQQNPTTGKNCKGEPANAVDLAALCKACGVKRVREVDPFDIKEMKQIIQEETAAEEASVIITRRPCILINRKAIKPALVINQDKCRHCGNCMKIGCPCIGQVDGEYRINAAQCVGCDLCTKLCPAGAIEK